MGRGNPSPPILLPTGIYKKSFSRRGWPLPFYKPKGDRDKSWDIDLKWARTNRAKRCRMSWLTGSASCICYNLQLCLEVHASQETKLLSVCFSHTVFKSSCKQSIATDSHQRRRGRFTMSCLTVILLPWKKGLPWPAWISLGFGYLWLAPRMEDTKVFTKELAFFVCLSLPHNFI